MNPLLEFVRLRDLRHWDSDVHFGDGCSDIS